MLILDRKSYLWDEKVVEALKELDEANLKFFGRVPVEEEYVPIVEVSFKVKNRFDFCWLLQLPGDIQNALKNANQNSETLNKNLAEGKIHFKNLILIFFSAKRKFESVNLNGEGFKENRWLNSSDYFENPFKEIDELLTSAQKSLNSIQEKISPISDPSAQLIKDSIPSTQKVLHFC